MPALDRAPAAPLELRLANERSEIERAHRLLDEYLTGPELDDRSAALTRLVVEELVANTITYGFPQGGRHEIGVTVAVQEDDVLIRVSDDGHPFDPFAQEPAAPAQSLADATIGARGLLLVQTMTSSRSYRRDGDRNVVEVRIAQTR